MSRVGRKVVVIPKGVNVNVAGVNLAVKGPKGELKREVPKGVSLKISGAELHVERADDSRENRAKHGMMRALVANMVKGVSEGFERRLEINGVGYRADVAGQKLNMALGFSHPVVFELPKVVQAKVDKNFIILTSFDREVLGETASKIRAIRPPEPYKGKGIKYVEEVIRRKVGKTGAA
ncbi:MAG TPA: 50S ribosomal protein L6 [Polyangia bacterium]|nr:50S ribosomal protein L6 [Polyangia bacterium]